MYADGTYLTSYCRRYIRKEKRMRTGKRILTALMVSCIAGMSLSFVCKVPLSNVNAAKESVHSKESVQSKERAAISCIMSTTDEEAVFEDILYKNITDMEVLAEELKIPIVFVDAGHGGEDGGCVSGGVLEKDINLEIAQLVKTKLEDYGYRVIMAREDDTYVSKEDRVAAANSAKADIYVSIHQNASEYASVSGAEVWYDGADSKRDSERLAKLVRQQIIKTTKSVERELRGNADFHVTGSTLMPACLIETGFLTNSAERSMLITQEYQSQIADGIVGGIKYFFQSDTM